MPSRTPLVAFGLAVIALGSLVACSSDSKSSGSKSSSTGAAADKAAFCRDNSDLDAATIKASTPSEVAQAFKDNDSKLNDALNHAPPEVKADTQLLVGAAKMVESTGDPAPFLSDPKLQAAASHLDSFCGVGSPTRNSDTSVSGSSTSESSSSSSSGTTGVSSTFEFSSSG